MPTFKKISLEVNCLYGRDKSNVGGDKTKWKFEIHKDVSSGENKFW